jgi:HAD superfamily hydrolase (TIGR01509 family)
MTIAHIIFDLGGVLVLDSEKIINEDMAKYLHIEPSRLKALKEEHSYAIKTGEMSLEKFYQGIISEIGRDNLRPKQVLRRHLDSYVRHTSTMDPEVLELIEKLREDNRYSVSCLTNTELEIARLSNSRGFFEIFDHSFISTEMKATKPDYGVYGRILDELDSEPSEAVLIDDSRVCFRAAKKIGMQAIKYENVWQLREELKEMGVNVDNN